MYNYEQIKVFTKEECDEILKMKTELVNRLTIGIPFESSWINGPQAKHDDTVILADSWVYDRLKEYWDNVYCKCTGQWPLIIKSYSKSCFCFTCNCIIISCCHILCGYANRW